MCLVRSAWGDCNVTRSELAQGVPVKSEKRPGESTATHTHRGLPLIYHELLSEFHYMKVLLLLGKNIPLVSQLTEERTVCCSLSSFYYLPENDNLAEIL